MKKVSASVVEAGDTLISFGGYRFPPGIISYAVSLYFRFPLSLRMVEAVRREIPACVATARFWSAL